jgi:CheY-like chemotaxis protein
MQINNLLVIDDDDLYNLLISEIISQIDSIKDYRIETSGYKALEYLQQCEKQKTFPEIILVDIKMPEMDGFEFVMNYEKKYFQNYPKTKIVVLSSSMRESDKTKALSYSSITEFMTKPITEEKLYKIIEI